MLVDIKPKYATRDFKDYSDGTIKRKGDFLGYWAIVKKVLTPKMKKCKVFSECIDAGWLAPVSDTIAEEINRQLEADSKHKAQFEETEIMRIGAHNRFMKLSPEQAADLESKLKHLPERFSEIEWKKIARLPKGCIDVDNMEANYLLNLFGRPWEITETYDQIYCSWQLVPFNTRT